MKDFLITVLPWCIAVTAMAAAGLAYLMFVREQEHSRKLYKHWEEGLRVNQVAVHHIQLLEAKLKRALEDDSSESWKNL